MLVFKTKALLREGCDLETRARRDVDRHHRAACSQSRCLERTSRNEPLLPFSDTDDDLQEREM